MQLGAPTYNPDELFEVSFLSDDVVDVLDIFTILEIGVMCYCCCTLNAYMCC